MHGGGVWFAFSNYIHIYLDLGTIVILLSVLSSLSDCIFAIYAFTLCLSLDESDYL